ncbi:putative T7SS-secreted protein [Streptomyces sp. NPDC008141]|uniref:putative T7SS-secreted protein n=1 Tax=Streptomyces sp. NPDC008141 TaxID=3364815 RepID=UPI0036ED14ED
MTPAPDYPHLGWNPVPGNPSAVSTLQTKLTSSAEALGTAHRLVSELLGQSSFWRGEAADAFRAAIDGELPRYLKNAHRSVSKAAKQLGRWHDDLVSYQATARRYDTQAKLDTAAITKAEAHHDLLRAAASTPEPELRAAAESVTKAREALASVRKLARELEDAHGAEAGRIAKGLNEATERLAPKEPGLLDRVGAWVDDNLGDVLGVLSATLGLVAIFATAPVAIPLLFAAAGLSLAALASHASDPKHTAALKAGFTQGKLDGQFWSSAVTLGGDALGVLPGVGAVAQGAKGMAAATRAGIAAETGTSATLRSGIHALGTDSAAAMREANDAPKPVLDWVVRRTHASAEKPLQAGVAGSAVLTGGVGLTPAEDDDAVRNSATGLDSARIAAVDGPGAGVNAARTWTHLTR